MQRFAIAGAISLALCAVVTSAFAQSAPSDPAANLGQDFQAFSVAQKHVVEDIQALVQEAQQQKKQIDDLTKQISEAKKDSLPTTPPPSK